MNSRTSMLFHLLIAIVLMPAASFSQAGKSGLSFLKLGVSGRGVSMGDAMSANISGAAATYYNPAGIRVDDAAQGASVELLLMHKEWIQDVRSEFLGAALQLDEGNTIGFSMNTATVSDIEVRTRPGTSEGSFTSRDFALGVSYARTLSENLRIGVTAKFLYEKIFVDEANGFAFDLGAQYITPVEHLAIGLAIANLGSTNDLRNENITLPSLLRFGPAYTLELENINSRVLLATDLLYIFPEKNTYANIGGEFLFQNALAVRAGYQTGSEGRGFSTGLGLRQGMFALDYGFVPLSANLGSGHTFSLGIIF